MTKSMKEILIVLSTILAVATAEMVTTDPKVSMMEEELRKEISLKKQSTSEVEMMPLELLPYPLQSENINKTKTCTLCEYLLLVFVYFGDITNVNEEKVKEFLGRVCIKIPTFIRDDCQNVVNTYGGAIVTTLAMDIDPSLVCSMIRICPSESLVNIWEEIPKNFISTKNKPNCPFCLLAVSQIYNVIKSDKTKTSIEVELNKLCNRLPRTLNIVCTNFVQTYSIGLVGLLLVDSSTEEVCNYLRLCVPTDNLDEM
ncbi:PREDICTED: prosaposin-like [Atta cephalotes]|uniref:Saposin B-type domain-containing protein n=1 Tax=Atta cephalotes TaxID=12957 RepID=A0A158NLL5_ATTCE|nr:PREDICTED: prosaposin-like [Atta cephalotes]